MKTAYEHSKELIQKVTPSMSCDVASFQQWQSAAREKLSQLLGLDKFQKTDLDVTIEYEQKTQGATEIRFTYQSEAGYRVPCHMLLPDGIQKPPVMICLQGHSKGMHISLGKPKYEGDENTIKGGRDFCVQAVKEGFAAIALEQRNFGECGGSENGPNCLESSMTALLMGRTTIGERVWDISRLIDVLHSQFGDVVDVNTICCMGNSGGGTATAYAAALEDRIALAMPSCAMSTFKDSIGAMRHCSCNYVPHIAEYFDMDDLMAMAYPKYFVQVSGKEDNIFPIFAAEQVFENGKRVYDAFQMGDRCALVKGNGGHRFYPDDAWPIVHKFLGI
ncbi:MAG: acetylxylan esterase [Oscillospiraceae bacterium]|nr:acetylxylan esterase [Oscillospiraceae bacterium]